MTGSEGSLMQFVIRNLVAAGHQVRGVDNFFRYGAIARKRNYEFVEADLCGPELARQAARGMEAVIQGAARIFGVTGFHKFRADILAHDVTLQQNLLWAAVQESVARFVYISSSMVYERCQSVPSREEDVDDMQIPHTDYGLSKVVGERLCRAFQAQYGLAYTIWRPFNIITPLETAEAEPGIAHVFADFIHRLVEGRENPLRILGDGQQVRCFTWIEDVVQPIVRHLASSETENQTFNLGNPRPITMRELAVQIYQLAQTKRLIPGSGELRFQELPAFADDVRVRVPAVEKAAARLGWSPSVSLEQALDRCLDAYSARVPVGTRGKNLNPTSAP